MEDLPTDLSDDPAAAMRRHQQQLTTSHDRILPNQSGPAAHRRLRAMDHRAEHTGDSTADKSPSATEGRPR